ncbi:MFS transporter [Radicibacter daui]|uniref:MFS transporter n=1 Tax=Radicibacter daui TaxID=3064829 RepID=UPI004046B73B
MSEATSRPLNRGDAKTLALASLGGALEFYDFIIYVFFAGVVGKLFFPADMPEWLEQLNTFGIFAAGYLARPLGGIIMAHFGDKTGRKRMFTLSIFLMALPTLLIGAMPTFASIGYAAPVLLLVMRLCQGAAIGGEAPGAWVFVAEHVSVKRVGLACGLLTGGLTGGILLGSLMSTAINSIYAPEEVMAFGWRIPFLVGGVFGVIAMYLRRYLEETPVFEEMRKRQSLVSRLPLGQMLRGHTPAVLVGMLATWTLTAGIVVVILSTPVLMQRLHHIPPVTTLIGSVCATITLTIGVVGTGMLLDRFNMLKVVTLGSIGLIASTYWLYIGTASNPAMLIPAYTVAGLFVGIINFVPVQLVRSFPSSVRFTGVSFTYNVAYAIFGGITPLAMQFMLKANPLGPAHYVAITTVIGVVATVLHGVLHRSKPTGHFEAHPEVA